MGVLCIHNIGSKCTVHICVQYENKAHSHSISNKFVNISRINWHVVSGVHDVISVSLRAQFASRHYYLKSCHCRISIDRCLDLIVFVWENDLCPTQTRWLKIIVYGVVTVRLRQVQLFVYAQWISKNHTLQT